MNNKKCEENKQEEMNSVIHCHSTHVFQRFPSQQHWALSGESEEKRIKDADVSSSNSLSSSKKTK